MVEIPVGSYAIILNDQQEYAHNLDEYLWNDSSFSYEFIMGPMQPSWGSEFPHELVLRASSQDNENPVSAESNGGYGFEGSYMVYRRLLFWSEKPFAVVQCDNGSWNNHKVFLAQEVTEHGLGRLPVFPLPAFVKSRAGLWKDEQRPRKWTRLTEVAALCELTPRQVLELHHKQFSGYMEDGVRFIRSENDLGVVQADDHERAWSQPDEQALINGPHNDIWVTKHFALCMLYMHMVGYHTDHPELKTTAA